MDDNFNILTNGWGHCELSLIDRFDCETWEDVEKFERKLLACKDFSAEVFNQQNLAWRNANGMHCRALNIPKGSFITGRIHANPYIDLLAYGKVHVTSFLEDGTREPPEVIEGFQFFEGKAGRKRVLESLEDSLWITCDRTEKEIIEDIEEDASFFFIDDYRKAKKMLEAGS